MNNPRPNPYIGPRAFKTGEALYGRDREIDQLFDLFIAERIVLLYSPSGAGKSSLVYAGLIPRLRQEGFQVLPVVRVNLDLPAGEQKKASETGTSAVNRYVFSTIASLEEGLQVDARPTSSGLADLKLDAYLDALLQKLDQALQKTERDDQPSHFPASYALIFDQFEEILTVDPTDQEHKLAFFQQLGAALRNRNLWALFVIREDYLAGLDPFARSIPTRFSSTFRLDLLGVEAAHQAIERPAGQAGVSYVAQTANRLVDDLRRVQVQLPDGSMQEQPGLYVEPVQLQVVCYRLWQSLAEDDHEIGSDDLAAIGDVNQSLADYYARWVDEIAAQTGSPERNIRRWVDQQLITESGIRSQVMLQPETSAGLDNKAIWALVDAHLVRAEKRRNATWFELAHDRLIRPIRADNAAWFAANLRKVQSGAETWERSKRSDAELLAGQTLADELAWAAAHPDELSVSEQDFLKASQQAEDQQKEMQRLEIERQRAEEKARAAGRLRRYFIIAVAAAIAAVIFAVFAVNQRQQAERLRQQADQQREIAVAQGDLAQTNEAKANQAGTQEGILRATADYNARIAAQNESTALVARDSEAAQKAVADENRARAERLAATVQAEATAQVPLSDSRLLAAQALSYLDAKPVLSSLLGIEAYHRAPTWEALNYLLTRVERETGLVMKPYGGAFPQQRSVVNRIAFSPDGQKIAWGSNDGSLTLYDRATEKSVSNTRHTQKIAYIAFSRDGSQLATAGYDKRILVWDVNQIGNPDYRPQELPNRVGGLGMSVDFSPDGKQLAAGIGAYFTIYNLATKESSSPKSYGNYVYNVAWSPDGGSVAAADVDGQLIVWDPTTGQRTFTPTGILPDGGVYSLAWSSDSQNLAVGDGKGNIILYDIESGKAIANAVHEERKAINGLAFSRDDRLLASGGRDGKINFWDVPGLKQAGQLTMDYMVYGLDFTASAGPNLLVSTGTRTDREGFINLFEILPASPLSHQEDQSPKDLNAISASEPDQLVQGFMKSRQVDYSQLPASLFTPGPFAIDQTGGWIATVSDAQTIQVYDTRSKKIRYQFVAEKPVLALAISSNGRWLASGHCLAGSPVTQGPACNKSSILLWNLEAGFESPSARPIEFDGWLQSLAFIPGTEKLVSGTNAGAIQEWDVIEGDLNRQASTWFPGSVSLLLFSPDGKILTSAGAGGKLVIWDSTNYQPIGEILQNPSGSITSLSFNNNGTRLYTGNADQAILSWDLDPADWVSRVCTIIGDHTPEDDLLKYLPPKPDGYKTCP